MTTLSVTDVLARDLYEYLRSHGPATAGDLVLLTRARPSGVTAALDRLADIGLAAINSGGEWAATDSTGAVLS